MYNSLLQLVFYFWFAAWECVLIGIYSLWGAEEGICFSLCSYADKVLLGNCSHGLVNEILNYGVNNFGNGMFCPLGVCQWEFLNLV